MDTNAGTSCKHVKSWSAALTAVGVVPDKQTVNRGEAWALKDAIESLEGSIVFVTDTVTVILTVVGQRWRVRSCL